MDTGTSVLYTIESENVRKRDKKRTRVDQKRGAIFLEISMYTRKNRPRLHSPISIEPATLDERRRIDSEATQTCCQGSKKLKIILLGFMRLEKVGDLMTCSSQQGVRGREKELGIRAVL